MMDAIAVPQGLEGVVVTETALGDVRGQEGFFHYRGHDATQLALERTLEDVWHLLAVGHLPDPGESAGFASEVAQARALPSEVVAQLPAIARAAGEDRMAALRTAWSLTGAVLGLRPWIDLSPGERRRQAVAIVAAGPALVAGLHRAASGRKPLAEAPGGTAAAYLYLLEGQVPEPRRAQALERYLILTIDHGLNASTFTARTVTSTGADLGASVVAGLAALSGPLHGGAPSRALDMLREIGSPDRAEDWVRDALGRGERIMGFGHRVYRTEDPRARLLRETARELGGELVELALHVERVVLEVLAELKPNRQLNVNVEYHAALVLEAVGIPPALFTPTFAISRAIGWGAHALEQTQHNRIMRPSSRYIGPAPERTVPAA